MKKEKFKSSVLSLSGFLVFAGIIITLNFIAGFLFFRIDLTRNRIYSLSHFSKELVRSLDEPVIIKVYFSPSLPSPYNSYRKYLQHLLDEYRVYARGNVTVDFVHHDDPKEFEQEAQRQGIPPLRFDQIAHDKYEIQVAYMGLTIHYLDSREVIPIVKSITGLEYDITSRIRRLVSVEKTTVGFLSGHGETDVLAEQAELSEAIQRDYDIRTVDLQGATTFPAGMETLMIIGPKEKFSETDLYAVDQYVMSGKPVCFLAGGLQADLEQFRTTTIATGLEKLIEHYGVKLGKGMVIDPQCQRIAISQRQGMFSIQNIVDFMYVPKIVRIGSDNPMVKDLRSISIPFASPLELALSEDGTVKAAELFRSSEHSWVKDRVLSINPFERLSPPGPGERKEHLLGVVLEGTWKSFFEKNPLPEGFEKDGIIRENAHPTRMIIIGSGSMMDSAMPLEKANFTFLANMLDWLTQDEGLIAIRSKGVDYTPIGEIPAVMRLLYKLVNWFLGPLLIVGIGIFRFFRRRAYKERIALTFKAGAYDD